MGWFESQIEQRRKNDDQLLEDSFVRIAGVVLGQRTAEKIGDARIITKSAIDEILKYYHFKPAEIPDGIREEEQLDYCLRPHGLMRRTVELTEGWYRDAYEGRRTALRPAPRNSFGIQLYRPEDGGAGEDRQKDRRPL